MKTKYKRSNCWVKNESKSVILKLRRGRVGGGGRRRGGRGGRSGRRRRGRRREGWVGAMINNSYCLGLRAYEGRDRRKEGREGGKIEDRKGGR